MDERQREYLRCHSEGTAQSHTKQETNERTNEWHRPSVNHRKPGDCNVGTARNQQQTTRRRWGPKRRTTTLKRRRPTKGRLPPRGQVQGVRLLTLLPPLPTTLLQLLLLPQQQQQQQQQQLLLLPLVLRAVTRRMTKNHQRARRRGLAVLMSIRLCEVL